MSEPMRAVARMKPCCPKCTYELEFPHQKNEAAAARNQSRVIVKCEFCNIEVEARFYEAQS